MRRLSAFMPNQPPACELYIILRGFLVKRACKEAVTSIPTILPITTETKEMMKLGASAEKPEIGPDWKWIAIENQGREHKVDLKDVIQMKMINDVQGREVDIDKQSSSGYSSASSTQSLNSSSVINNNIHISIINGQSDQSATVKKTEKDATQPENVWNQAHCGVEEISTVNYSHAKPVSDDDQNAKIGLLQTSVDINDLKN